MSDIIGVVEHVEDDDYQGKAFKKVALNDGTILKVKYGREGALKAKWGLLQGGAAIKFTMMDYTKPDGVKIPYVSDIEAVNLPPPQSDQNVLPEHQKIIDKSIPDEPEKPPPAPQAVGMMTKEIGDMIRAGMLDKIYGKIISLALVKWYRQQGLGITRIEFDSKDLPNFSE